MAGRTNRLRNSKSRVQTRPKLHVESLDYHEGLSSNQVKIILVEFGFGDRIDEFNEWMDGQTCPIVYRFDRNFKSIIVGNLRPEGGVYEYDLFRWIENQKKGTSLIWD